MPRSSVREDLQRRLREHLAVAETHSPEECPLDVRGVAAALGISPTSLYKYGFNREMNAAEQRQRDSGIASGTAIENQYYHDQVRALTQEVEKERERSKGLVGRIAIRRRTPPGLGSIRRRCISRSSSQCARHHEPELGSPRGSAGSSDDAHISHILDAL